MARRSSWVASSAVPVFQRGDLRLHHTQRGDPDGPPLVLLHGLLWSARMFERLVRLLPEERVILLDLHGHGRSSRPTDPSRYTWREMAADVVALLDHLGLERAVVGGLSLGANVTLATAYEAPDRVEGMVLEMPVLQRGHPLGERVFGAMATGFRTASPVLRPVAAAVRRLPAPRRIPEAAAIRDVAGAPPGPASALLQGLLADDPLPEDPDSLARLTMPALVIGHGRDPLHVLDDARDLADRLPHARLVEVPSILELRLRPERLATELRRFLADVRGAPPG